MIKLEENERIDWFRIFADLRRCEYSVLRVSRETGIPKSTLQGWIQEIGNPRFEKGLLVIEFWARVCKRKIKDVPRRNVFKPFS